MGMSAEGRLAHSAAQPFQWVEQRSGGLRHHSSAHLHPSLGHALSIPASLGAIRALTTHKEPHKTMHPDPAGREVSIF